MDGLSATIDRPTNEQGFASAEQLANMASVEAARRLDDLRVETFNSTTGFTESAEDRANAARLDVRNVTYAAEIPEANEVAPVDERHATLYISTISGHLANLRDMSAVDTLR